MKICPENIYDQVKVIINGAWIGITNNALSLYNQLKEKKIQRNY